MLRWTGAFFNCTKMARPNNRPPTQKSKSDHQKCMSVHAEELHGRQIRQYQVGFASARMFRLRIGECGKQQDQKGHPGLVPPLQEGFNAFLKGAGDLLRIRRSDVRAGDLARREKCHDQ